jgi:hypothetical protein
MSESDSNSPDTSSIISTTSSTTSIITSSNSNLLNLPFHITNDHKTITKTKHYFDNLLLIIWGKHMTFEDYLNEILSFKNKYFSMQNNAQLALNQRIYKKPRIL